MIGRPVLYDYWRSSASYRVRIALSLVDRAYDRRAVDLLAGAHHAPDYLVVNPQALVPALVIDGRTLTQSLAIIEYLHATTLGSTLLPSDPIGQHRVRRLSYAIAMEIHPICNTSVAAHVSDLTGGGDEAKMAWMDRFIGQGLAKLETMLDQGGAGAFCYGEYPTMADCCLIPQIYNADRWGVEYACHPNISRIARTARALNAFSATEPEGIGPPQN